MPKAQGGFEVKMTPDSPDDRVEGNTLRVLVVDKEYHGDLEASSRGHMLTGMTAVEDSAGYVLIERLQGSLRGRTGTFLLQHYGIMDHGATHQLVEVIPDSGTGELRGLAGRMTGTIVDGAHSYELDYS